MTQDPSSRPPTPPKKSPRKNSSGKDVVRLEDLAPRTDVRGGGRKRLFGEEAPSQGQRRRDD